MDKFIQALGDNIQDPRSPIEPRVVVTRPFVNLFTMQVCAVKDATDDEILSVCNLENHAGTSNGWARVIREHGDEGSASSAPGPIQCADHGDRMHFLVVC